MATSGTSVRLKRLRQRFGINAPRLAIRTHVAWYWRALSVIAMLAVSLTLAAWLYDAWRGIAGFRGNDSSVREIQSLRNHVMELDAELTKLRSLAGSGESTLQIERATRDRLSHQVKALENENAALKEDLAFFEGLMPSSGTGDEAGVKIDHLRVDPGNSPDEYRYRLLVVNNGGRQAREFKGNLLFLVKVQQAGKDAMISVPSGGESDSQRFRFDIKHFHRVEGAFSVPSGAVVKSVEARLLQDGTLRARQSVVF